MKQTHTQKLPLGGVGGGGWGRTMEGLGNEKWECQNEKFISIM